MEDNILKKMAIRSTAFMVTVLMISTACKNYSDIAIFANENKKTTTVETSPLDVENIDIEVNDIEVLSSMDGKVYNAAPDEILSDKYILVKKPEDSGPTISLEDLYMERSIKLTITGLKTENLNYDNVIRMNNSDSFTGKPDNVLEDDIEITKDFAKKIGITYDHNIERDEFTATIKMELDTVYVYSLYQDSQYYYINLQRPKDVYDKLIVIDAGHGGYDVGTFPKDMSYLEKDMNLSMVLYLKQLLDSEDIKVYYTRLTDVKPYLRPRVSLANDLDADLFISIHCNGSNLIQPHGTEILYNEQWNRDGFSSKQLAEVCLEELTKTIGLRNRGIVEGSEKYIVGHSKVPVALIEVAYMTNPEDLEFLKNSDNRKLVAKGIYNGIMRYYEEYDK
ncbi:N-acetylmuramoyl-L-alanine amidase [Mobilisporobacter senegalensis]|uniref:N-acetylmuramoyl-L-alanine amidase n=1 Tax=Mobilisporobacter senegalensis TaxID=1329262 RepID=A0A3N1XPY9_9FIRM|nr:N-acetylmuramoyl-L-alanine amidase [Mobilisporobacter senegalensis]ROR28743.1 N-acetylmuramoyl-L-alanine amidase [Mobilisporobacter senegalensis]